MQASDWLMVRDGGVTGVTFYDLGLYALKLNLASLRWGVFISLKQLEICIRCCYLVKQRMGEEWEERPLP